jgi:hypothetical protein
MSRQLKMKGPQMRAFRFKRYESEPERPSGEASDREAVIKRPRYGS